MSHKSRLSRTSARQRTMTQRINNTHLHKYLKDLSPAVAEHLTRLNFNTLNAELTKQMAAKSRKNLSLGDAYPAIFVSSTQTINPLDDSSWKTRLGAGDAGIDSDLKTFIDTTIDTYNTKNKKYNYNDLPYRLFRVAELYEATDADVKTRLDTYKAGIDKYYNLSQKDNAAKQELEPWRLAELKHKIDTQDAKCNGKFKLGKSGDYPGVCPLDIYYGPFDIPIPMPDKLEDLKFESIIDYFLDKTDDKSCYKNHLRQYIIGSLKDTEPFEKLNKYFHPEPSKVYNKYKEISWGPVMNDIYMKCLMEHTFNNINPPLFPLRVFVDARYINMGGNPNVSRYDYVTGPDLKKMDYLGCFLVPLYQYFFVDSSGTTNYIEASTRINGSPNIEAEFRKDITGKSKHSYNEAEYIARLDSMIDLLTSGNPEENLHIQHANHSSKGVFVKRRDIRRGVFVYNIHLFQQNGITKKFRTINHRSNVIAPGFILDRFKVLYIELSQMYYLLKNTYKLPSFRMYRYLDTNMFFFSPYYDHRDFIQKQSDLLEELKTEHANKLEVSGNINITSESLKRFYKSLKPYDVIIDPRYGNSIVLKPLAGYPTVNLSSDIKLIGGARLSHKKHPAIKFNKSRKLNKKF